ncbi:MAG: acyl--CoA ligase [Clostridia bacterium]|nr:acyl--CoA ligase [Clostridia bacterium]
MNYFVKNMLPEEQNLIPYLPTTSDFLRFIADRYGERTALSDAVRSVDYCVLEKHVGQKRSFLNLHQIPAGAHVGLMSRNSIDAVEWFLAVTSYGCAAVMMPASLQAEILPGIAAHLELQLLITDDEELSSRGHIDDTPIISTACAGEGYCLPANTTPGDLAAIFFTGGTTGKPKGAMLSHGALMRGALNGSYRRGTVFGQTFVAALPFTHVFGMIFSLLSGLYTGSHVAVCGEMRNLFREMQRAKPTTMIAVPGMAELMLKMAKSHGASVLGSRLKLIICGAAPVPERLRKGFLPLGVDVLAGYGMTETANLVSGNLDMDTHPTSVGKQYPEQRLRIVEGELQLQGDMLFDGYWKDEAATKAAFTEDGWFRTGDLAKVDDLGYLYITGRIKNLIILENGENVSPEEVEDFYYACQMVKDCLISETVINGKAAILLEVQPQPEVQEQALLDELQQLTKKLPPPMRPARIEIRHSDFERSASMKIIRKGARKHD